VVAHTRSAAGSQYRQVEKTGYLEHRNDEKLLLGIVFALLLLLLLWFLLAKTETLSAKTETLSAKTETLSAKTEV
jgi:ABC-type uncharacterized transport system permease subunit